MREFNSTVRGHRFRNLINATLYFVTVDALFFDGVRGIASVLPISTTTGLETTPDHGKIMKVINCESI